MTAVVAVLVVLLAAGAIAAGLAAGTLLGLGVRHHTRPRGER